MEFAPSALEAIKSSAAWLKCEPEALQAVVMTESQATDMADGIQDGKVNGYCIIRIEGHYFYKALEADPVKLKKAVKAGLANKKAGAVKNPGSMGGRHAMLQKMIEIDEVAAYKSISMGVGQVMGNNYAMCGYATVQDMWKDAQDLSGQVTMMAKFIKADHLDDELRSLAFGPFARGYNGPGYAVNKYDTIMLSNYRQLGGKAKPEAYVAGFLKLGDPRKDEVLVLQNRLKTLGYQVNPDGDFGPSTKSAVQLFQLEHDLSPDGVAGLKTQDALRTAAPRKIGTERASATESDLKETSGIVKKGANIRNLAAFASVGGVAYKGADETGALDALSSVSDHATRLQSALEPLQGVFAFAKDNLWIIGVVAALAVAYYANKIVQNRIDDHRSGRTV